MAQGTCVKCGAEDRYLPGRSLCSKCYDHHWRRGTLDEFPCRPPKVPEPRTHRVCPICKEDLPLDAFARSKDRWDGHATYCKPCARDTYHVPARQRKRQVERPLDGEQWCVRCETTLPYDEFYWENDKGRYRSYCKSCSRTHGKRYWRENGSELQWQRQLKSKFGLTVADYDRMLAEQDGGCAICGRTAEDVSRLRLSVDHCHTSGRVRALLCGPCNTGIGMFREIPELFKNAAEYVQKHGDP